MAVFSQISRSRAGREQVGTARVGAIYTLVALICALCLASPTRAAGTATGLFLETQPLVYQIRVIDIASGDKFSIGSGFHVSDAGHIATNFHVVSSYVHEPEKYRLESVRHDGAVTPLKLLSTDVVHDLALLWTDDSPGQFLELADSRLAKGDRIYSMGNPRDHGMTIIEGTYNGLVENSRYRKILFSGSLNAGMSGGPALNRAGKVIGINVSKGGEQLSFLVPAAHLKALLAESVGAPPVQDHTDRITRALVADQAAFYSGLTNSTAAAKPLGDLTVPGKLAQSLRCWGHSVDKEEEKYSAAHQHCRSEDQIFVSGDLYVGDFNYNFEYIQTQELNRSQFYTFLQERFTHRYFSNTMDAEQATEFRCHDRFVEMHANTWKISTCMRAFKKFEGLFDASMAMVSLDYPDKAAVVTVGASGISADNAVAIFRHIAESVTWTR